MAEDGEKKSRFKRRPRSLGSRRRLGSKRRGRKSEDEGEEEESEEGGDDKSEGDDEDGGSDEDSSSSDASDDEPAPTEVVPSPKIGPGSATPTVPTPAPTRGETLVKVKSKLNWFTREFGQFLMELGRDVQAGGQRFGSDVVKPFSRAVMEALLCIVLAIMTCGLGFVGGRALYAQSHKPRAKVVNSKIPTTRNLGITPGKGRKSRPLPTRDGKDAAEAVLAAFLANINKANYPRAYALLSSDWKRELSASKFEQGFSQSKDIKYRVLDSVELGKDRVQIDVTLQVTENGKPRKYDYTYMMVRGADGWKLDSGNVR